MTTGIALSGGGTKGDFQVGALRLLYDRGVRPDLICGVSVGAINAVKLAEGENPANPRQGLAGLVELWSSLQRDSDMYVEADWLSDPRMSPAIRDFLTGRSGRLAIQAPATPGPELGDVIGPLVGLVEGLVFLGGDGRAVLESLGVIQQRARNLFELSPIQARLTSRLDPALVARWAAGGGRLRLGTVALESGRLRYVTETGAVVETDGTPVPDTGSPAAACRPLVAALEAARTSLAGQQAELRDAPPGQKPALRAQLEEARREVQAAAARLAACQATGPQRPLVVPLAAGALASASIPGIFRPVELGGETYVDGGVREVLPLQAAVDLGADTVYAIDASRPDLLPAPVSYASAGVLDLVSRALVDIAIHEIAVGDHAVRLRPGQPAPRVFDIHPDVDLHGITTVDPGLIRIAMDYGYQRAADVLDGADPAGRRYRIATDIAERRLDTWALENAAAGQPDPRVPGQSPRPADPSLRPRIEAGKQALAALLAERRSLGGPDPAGIETFSGRPELHPWLGPVNDARVVAVTPPADDAAPGARVPASVTMRNTGTTTWTAAEAYALGSQQPQDNLVWGTGRVGLPGPVPPGTEVTFAFPVTVPAPPEALFAWQMVQDGVEWFGAPTAPVAVRIAEPSRCAAIRQTVAANTEDIRTLRNARGQLDPRDPLDREEIRLMGKQITDLEAEVQRLRAEAGGLGCTAIP
ncbi:MAG TPA: patatin-like phospholipase family protein [Mycobacteriales bacterium]